MSSAEAESMSITSCLNLMPSRQGRSQMDESNPYSPPLSDPVPSPAASPPDLWNPDAAGAWSLLFTPVFGSVLLLKNWQAIGRDDKVKAARIWLIVSCVMFVLTIMIGGIGMIYIIIWYFAWQKPQTRYVKAQWGKDYPRKPWRKPLLVGFSCWGGLIILFILLIFSVQA